MKSISLDDIENLQIRPKQCYEWVKEVLKIKKECILPPKISMKQDGHIFYNVMPCIIPPLNVAGVKFVTRFPDRDPSIKGEITLYDTSSGESKAFLDGTYITNMRTGAVAAVTIMELAQKDFSDIGLIGLGNTAKASIDVLLDVIGQRKLTIKLYRYKDQAEKFKERYKSNENVNFIICNTHKQVIENSDVIISSITYADANLGDDEWYKEGCLVVPIHTLGFQNCDLFFDKVICDDIGHVKDFKYFNKFKEVSELSDILNDDSKGRKEEKQRIIAYNIGIAIHDIYFAEKIYELCSNNIKK